VSARALITGLTGQDGSFLAELLLAEGYEVTGLVRDEDKLGASEHLRGQLELIAGDLLDHDSLGSAVVSVRADELYHLAAPSFIPASWIQPAQTITAISLATAVLLEAVREHTPHARVFIASSAAMFAGAPSSPQTEDTPCLPRTPYAVAKSAAHYLAGCMREQQGLFVCSGVLYNHESERRPPQFVTRKITNAAARIKLGLAGEVTLGDLEAVRDWSFAGDIMRGAWLALQQDEPRDYILASGVPHTVREFAEVAFASLGLQAQEHIQIDPTLKRPPDPTALIGNPSRAQRIGWRSQLTFEQLIERMVDHDLRSLR
jgi:GDPmannose 4,6-dehydratase